MATIGGAAMMIIVMWIIRNNRITKQRAKRLMK